MTRKPVFLSLVGPHETTTNLYRELVYRWPATIRGKACEFLGDPLADHWENLRIGEKRKRDFSPAARLLFRWGFFYEYNVNVVLPAFRRGADIILVRQFGFDVYAGALARNDCEQSLSLHMALVPCGVYGLGLSAPLYVFTEGLDPRTQLNRSRYFTSESGQRAHDIDPSLSSGAKIAALTEVVREELAKREAVAA